MDSVRFGRALGFGARSAARALATAVDAASTPNPTPAKPAPARPTASSQAAPTPPPVRPAVHAAARTAARTVVHTRNTTAGIARGSKRFGESVWGPFLKLSGVLWLEITGSFFGLFALFAAQNIWKHRADFHHAAANPTGARDLLVSCAFCLLFTFFTVQSFVRAHRRSHGR